MSKTFFDFSNFLTTNPTLNVSFDRGDENLPTIVFLHGLAATSAVWEPIKHKLNFTDYRIIAIDLLGFGGSQLPENATYSVEEHARYVRRTLKQMNVMTPFKLVGHSMGSLVAANYAYHWPNDVARAYYVGMPLYIQDKGLLSKSGSLKTAWYLYGYKVLTKTKRFTISSTNKLRKVLKIKEGIDVNSKNWGAFKQSMEKTVLSQNTYQEIAHSRVPVYMVYGSLDEFVVKESIEIASNLKHVEQHVVRGSDHKLDDKLLDELVSLLKTT